MVVSGAVVGLVAGQSIGFDLCLRELGETPVRGLDLDERVSAVDGPRLEVVRAVQIVGVPADTLPLVDEVLVGRETELVDTHDALEAHW